MWILINDAFFSIVDEGAHKTGKRAPRRKSDTLLVRARIKGDIERYFPGAKVTRTPERDYLFRATVKRADVEAAIAKAVSGVDYGNFKDSVRDRRRHDAYAACWTALYRYQREADAALRRNDARREPW